MAILREVPCKEWIYRNTAQFFEPLDAPFVTHILVDGHKRSRNMQEPYYVYFCTYLCAFYVHLCAFVGVITIANCSVHRHGLFKIDQMLVSLP